MTICWPLSSLLSWDGKGAKRWLSHGGLQQQWTNTWHLYVALLFLSWNAHRVTACCYEVIVTDMRLLFHTQHINILLCCQSSAMLLNRHLDCKKNCYNWWVVLCCFMYWRQWNTIQEVQLEGSCVCLKSLLYAKTQHSHRQDCTTLQSYPSGKCFIFGHDNYEVKTRNTSLWYKVIHLTGLLLWLSPLWWRSRCINTLPSFKWLRCVLCFHTEWKLCEHNVRTGTLWHQWICEAFLSYYLFFTHPTIVWINIYHGAITVLWK